MKKIEDQEALREELAVDELWMTDLIVVGSGVAGLSAALASVPRDVVLVSKAKLRSGSSPWAQGGIAAAVGEGDDPALHAEDTVRVARGLGKPEVIRALVESAPAEIDRLIELGTRFDVDSKGELSLGREGGHSRFRILHAGGDATGAEIVRALVEEVRQHESIHIEEDLFAIDLVVDRSADRGGAEQPRVVGIEALRERPGKHPLRVAILASDTLLATGGIGQVYRYTTNPNEVTGDGIAMAARAGARLVDMEFVQFHPTALAIDPEEAHELVSSPLLTEALRGAGAHLVDESGRRFMQAIHPDGELAPRDLVARTIWQQRSDGHEVFLDLRHLAQQLPKKFPTVLATCSQVGLDPTREPIPVSPAAHYFMGGIEVDAEGRSSLPGLWACGEAASTGVHGANRLASNSLLEGLVFGAGVAAAAARSAVSMDLDGSAELRVAGPALRPRRSGAIGDRQLVRARLRDVMWQGAGLERSASGLEAALGELEVLRRDVPDSAFEVHSVATGELRNMLLIGRLVIEAALERRESRGSQYRLDYPETVASWRRRLPLRLVDDRTRFETPLPERTTREAVLAGGG